MVQDRYSDYGTQIGSHLWSNSDELRAIFKSLQLQHTLLTTVFRKIQSTFDENTITYQLEIIHGLLTVIQELSWAIFRSFLSCIWYYHLFPVTSHCTGPHPAWLLQQHAGWASCQLDPHLQLVQNVAEWLIFGICHSEHIMDALASLHWLRVPERILFKVTVLAYRAVNGSAPVYLLSYFTHVAEVPSRLRLRSSNSDQLTVPSFNPTTVSKRAFPVSTANLWNSLPTYLTSALSLTI